MVGNISTEKEAMFGQLLAKYFLRPKTLFIMSSDFCHWGKIEFIDQDFYLLFYKRLLFMFFCKR